MVAPSSGVHRCKRIVTASASSTQDRLCALGVNEVLAQQLVSETAAAGMSTEVLQERVQFLSNLCVKEELAQLITEHFLIHGTLTPLLDPTKASAMQELCSFLYQLGFSPREIGEAFQRLPQLTEMSSGTLGLRVLRCKSIGMETPHIVQLFSAAPVLATWGDECMDPLRSKLCRVQLWWLWLPLEATPVLCCRLPHGSSVSSRDTLPHAPRPTAELHAQSIWRFLGKALPSRRTSDTVPHDCGFRHLQRAGAHRSSCESRHVSILGRSGSGIAPGPRQQ
jgi:mTERF